MISSASPTPYSAASARRQQRYGDRKYTPPRELPAGDVVTEIASVNCLVVKAENHFIDEFTERTLSGPLGNPGGRTAALQYLKANRKTAVEILWHSGHRQTELGCICIGLRF